MVIRDLRQSWDLAQLWPMLEIILAWDKIEELLADDQAS